MKKHVALFSAAVLCLGLVAACSDSSDIAIDVDIDIDRWIGEVTTAASEMTTAHLVMETDAKIGSYSIGATLDGDVDVTDPDNPKAAMSMSMGPSTTEAILVDGTRYQRQGSGRYEETPVEELDDSATNFNPGADLGQARTAITKVERIGTEPVEKVQATHYKVTYDLAKLKEIGEATDNVTSDPFEHHLWLDDKMRVVKISSRVEMLADDGQDSVMTITMVFTDFGKPVTITAPY